MIHKMKCEDAAVAGISVHARECCEHFGLPYSARLLPYGRQEVSRVHKEMNMIGCLNQDSSLPLIVWYPEGNWLGERDRGVDCLVNENSIPAATVRRYPRKRRDTMNAEEAFLLDYIGRTKISDGREVVVYSDGQYRHAVEASHWDDCGFSSTDDAEQRASNFDCWNAASRHWLDDQAAVEAARNLSLAMIHSANGLCTPLDVEVL